MYLWESFSANHVKWSPEVLNHMHRCCAWSWIDFHLLRKLTISKLLMGVEWTRIRTSLQWFANACSVHWWAVLKRSRESPASLLAQILWPADIQQSVFSIREGRLCKQLVMSARSSAFSVWYSVSIIIPLGRLWPAQKYSVFWHEKYFQFFSIP